MSVKVQKYIANLGKSVAYTTADVLSQKFEVVNDFRNENREVFTSAYSSIKNYRTTYATIKKAITNNKVMDAARVGFDSIVYSVTTGDFYAKAKEQEVISKFGGSLMSDMDIDSDDFDFDNEGVTDGDKVIATAVKKNSKISTAITTEAIVKTGKAQMDVSRENTMLLYTQNERLINKLDGGFENIMGFLRQSGEQSTKVQNQMNENLNKFMTSVDNNLTRVTKQLDEMLEMQRIMYKGATANDQQSKKKIGYDDIITRNGVINIREYTRQVGKNAFGAINDAFGGNLSMLFGDTLGEGSNMLAQIAANPMRELSKAAINKALGKRFDEAAKQLNNTLSNIVPDLIARAYSSGKKSDNGLAGILGKIFGIKPGASESVNTGAYNKGPIPFDGITKKSIVEVIPTYLRKIASSLTGNEEMAYDFNTGKWTTMRNVQQGVNKTLNAGRDSTAALLRSVLEGSTGRRMDTWFGTRDNYKKMSDSLTSLASKIFSSGDITGISRSDLTSQETILYDALMRSFSNGLNNGGYIIDRNTGRRIKANKQSIVGMNKKLRDIYVSHNAGIKRLNESDADIARLALAEDIGGIRPEAYHGKSYVNNKGDMNQRHIQEMPVAQVMLRAKDEYGVTLYQYLRNIGASLSVVMHNSDYLQILPNIGRRLGGGPGPGGHGGGPGPSGHGGGPSHPSPFIPTFSSLNHSNNIDYGASTKDEYNGEYYSKKLANEDKKAAESYQRSLEEFKRRRRDKHKDATIVTDLYQFSGENGSIGLKSLVETGNVDAETAAYLDYIKEEEKADKAKWKRREEWLGKERTDKLRDFDKTIDTSKPMLSNLKQAKGVTEKLFVIGKYFSAKSNGSLSDKASETILKVDTWLQNLIYGENVKPEDQRLSLFDRMKKSVDENFRKITETIKKGFDWIKGKMSPILKPVGEFFTKIFGKVDSQGNIESNGLFAPFMSGFRRGMVRNSDDLWQWTKQHAKSATDKIKETTGIGSTESGPAPAPAPYSPIHHTQYNQQQQFYVEKLDRAQKRIYDLQRQINNKQNYINELRQYLNDARVMMESYSHYGNKGPEWERAKEEAFAYRRLINQEEKEIAKMQSQLSEIKKSYNELVAKAQAAGLNNIQTMAAGGVNRTGHAFASILSPGEYLNGSKISAMGVYTIPKGGVVYNPAPASVRNRQAIQERQFKNKLRSNADANDNLTPLTGNQQQDDAAARAEYEKIIGTDWTSLEDSRARSIFLGNLASKGVLGGAIGLLAGGPILGASIGAASALTKSSGAFANFLFGTSEKDDQGMIKVDENGNIVRANDGLISKEIQKAVPDIKKFGAAGLIGGLITPLGPLGGVLIGSALGFAKNSEIFQGTIFGEDGIFSKENTDKLKKGAKNIGAGAIIGALAMPGPFGLVGSALLGATAGYVTSTDKFKDFLLGEEINGKRRGGVIGVLKDQVVNPLKDFGHTIVDKTMDEIFGVMGDDGKRNGDDGLFGAIRANVIRPMTQGAQSIYKEFTNKLTDISDMLGDSIKKIKASFAGNDTIGGVMESATRIAGGIIHGAGAVGRFATKPFRLLGDEGIGGRLKAKRILSGRADDMTARERLIYRGKLGMANTDAWSATDSALAGMSKDDMSTLLNVLNYDANGGKVDGDLNRIYNHLGMQLREIMPRGDVKKIIKFLKTKKYREAERFVNTRNLPDDVKAQIRGLLADFRGKVDKVNADYESISKSQVSAQEYLLQRGINVDISDEKKKRNILRMATREMAHFDSGLTEEEREWEVQNKFWSGKDSPLNPVTQAAENIETILQKIYYDLSLGQDYDKLSAEDKAKFGSRQEYIEKHRAGAIENAVTASASNSKFTVGNGKFGNVTAKSIRESSFLTNDIINDYLPFYTGNLKDTMSPDNKLDYLSSKFDDIMGTACSLFDSEALKALANPAAVETDVRLRLQKDKFYISPTDNIFEMVGNRELTRNDVVITGNGGQAYTFSMTYTVNGTTINPTEKQPDSFNNEKQRFVEDYLRAHVPEDQAESYMSLGKMLKISLKFGAYFSAAMITGISLPALDFLIKHRKSIAKKVKGAVSKIAFNAKMIIGSHDLDDSSFMQRTKNEKYKEQAYIAWDKELTEYRKGDVARGYAARSNTKKDEFMALADKKEALINSIIQECGLSGKYDDLDDSEKEKVREKFVSMYVSAKKNGQLFGRGLMGDFKHLTKSIKSKIAAPFKKFNDVIFNANKGTNYQERVENIKKNLEKKARNVLNNVIIPYMKLDPLDGSPKAADIRLRYQSYKSLVSDIVKDIYPEANGDLKSLPDDKMEEFGQVFIARFSSERYQDLLGDKSNMTFAEKAREFLTTVVKSAGRKIVDLKDKAAARAHKKEVTELLNKAIKDGDPKVDEIANAKYQVPFDQLNDDQKSVVAEAYYNDYNESHGLKGFIKRTTSAGSLLSLSGNFGKSGKKNRDAGSIDKLRAWKEKQQEQDTTLGRFFDKLDARQAKKDKETFKGKKDSKLAKILKWIFIGGIAVPIIVGFVKEKLLPAIHDKIQPWLAKAKDKLIGVKNESTGEYEGGLVSGIVNPIRKFFRDKLSGVHDWFKNEGKYKSEDTGLKGFIKNIKSVGEYVIGLWKVGANEVFGSLLPKIAYGIGKRALKMAGMVIKGLADDIVDRIKGKERQASTDWSDTEKGSDGTITTTSGGYTVTANDTFGGKIEMNIPSVTTNYNIPQTSNSSVSKTYNNDGTATYSNQTTGATAKSEKISSVYNTTATKGGTKFFKKSDGSSQLEYVYDAASDSYIPAIDYQRVQNESYANNKYADNYKKLAENNMLRADYSASQSAGEKLLGAFGKQMILRNNLAIRNPAAYKAIYGSLDNLTELGFKGLSKLNLPLVGKFNKVVGLAGQGVTKTASTVSKMGMGFQTAAYEAIDGVTGIGTKIAEKEAAKLAEKEAAKVAAETAAESSTSALGSAVKNTKIGSKASDIVTKIKDAIKWLKDHLGGAFKKLFKSKDAAKAIGKGASESADEIGEGAAKAVTQSLDDCVDDIAKNASAGAQGLSKALPWIMVVADFVSGFDNCRNILGIIDPKPKLIERFMGGIINCLPSLISSIAQTIVTAAGIATAGVAAVALAGVMIGLGIIVQIILTLPKVRNAIIDGLSKVLSKIPGLADDMEELAEKRRQAQEELENYNERNNTNLSIEEYNNLIGNETAGSKFIKMVKDDFSSHLGYDAATKNTLLDRTTEVASYDDTDKVRKKLVKVFSSIWEFFGESDFNSLDAVDAEGNELSEKDKLNANHMKFMDAAEKIIVDLIGLCDKEKQTVRDDVYGNVTDFTGPIDAAIHLKSVYKKGKKHPTNQFDVDEEHASWGRIKAIAGVCAIINEIFAPLNNKEQVTRVVVSTMIPIYFGSQKDDEEVLNWSNKKYSLDMSKYDSNGPSSKPTSSATSEFIGPTQLVTNANANNKLSPIGNKGAPQFDFFQQAIASTINSAMTEISGGNGFKKVGAVVNELTKKNAQINRKIDQLKLLPTDDNYWDIKADDDQPFASSIYSFMENINRVVKAPFALAAAMNAASASSIVTASSSNNNTANNNKSNNSNNGGTNNASSSGNKGFFGKIADTLKSVGSAVSKFFFGKGKNDSEYGMGTGDSDASDPYHIYQRAFNQSYNTTGDREHQSVADSGCGPASAASVLRMYGKKGSMNNAVKFALRNKYKEKDGGTYPEYFTHYFAKNGIASNPNASNADVVNSLVHGNPVVLMGQDRSGSNNTPYGKRYSHYVVARGLDKHGNVIVEDSEDRKGSTRYSLADTLRNTSVRITTGKGYGMAKDDDMGVGSRYITNVNAAISASVSSIINSALNGSNIQSSSGATSSSSASDTGGYVGSGNAAKAKGKRLSLVDKFGRTFAISITDDEVELYDMLTTKGKFNSAVACGILANWECECGINTIKSVATRGVIAYGGGIMQWTPGDKHVAWARSHGYGSDVWSWEANKAHAMWELTEGADQHSWGNPKNAKPSFESVGLTPVSNMEEFRKLTDVESAAANYERVFEVSWNWDGHTSESWGQFDSRNLYDYPRRLYAILLYDLIVKGKSDENKDSKKDTSGSGRGKLDQYMNVNNKFGRAEDDEATTTETPTGVETTTESETTTSDTPAVSTDAKDSRAKGLIKLLSSYAKGLTKGIFGNFYDALYGSQPTQSTGSKQNDNSGSVTRTSTIDIDSEDTIICGDSITAGLASTPLKERALGLVSGGTLSYKRKIGGNSYETIFKAHSDVIKKAKNIIFFWGMNELTADGKSPDEYMRIYQDSIDTILGYAGKKASDCNVCIMSVISVPEPNSSGIGNSLIKKFNENYLKFICAKKGYPYINIFDTCLAELKTNPNNVHPNSQSLYEIIKKVLSGGGSGRGKGKNILKHFSGKAKYGRDGEEETTTPDTTTTETIEEAADTTKTTTNTKDPFAKSFISKFGKYITGAVKGVYGNFYDAVYGSQPVQSTSSADDTGNIGTTGSKNDILYAAAMVFEGACSHMEKTTRIARDQTITNIVCKDGTKIDHINVHCNGMMCAIIHYMGYYTVRQSGRSYNESYHGDSWGAANSFWQEGDRPKIYDADGNLSNDWVFVQPSDGGVQPGDISLACLNGPHMDMYAYTSSGGDRGYNGGANESLERSYQLAKYYLQNGKFPTDQDLGAIGTLRGAKLIIRYVGGSGSGRGKKVDYAKLNAKIPVVHNNNSPATIRNTKYGYGTWGREVDEEIKDTAVNTESTEDVVTDNTADTTTVSSPANEKVNAKVLISKLSKYAKAGIKGIYGNFYDAIYGSMPETEYGSESDDGATASYRGNDVIYAAAMVFEALYKADPSLRYDATFGTLHTLTCRDGTVLEHIRPDCSGMMCAVMEYMGYYTPRYQAWPYSKTFRGTGWDLGVFTPGYNVGLQVFDDETGTPSQDWVCIAYDPNDKRPGDIRFHNGHRHTDMFIFEHNGHDYGVNAGSGDCGGSIGNGMYNSYIFGKFYLDNGRLPNDTEFGANANGSRGTVGTWCIQPNETKCVLRYVGKRGSGRGKGKSSANLRRTIGAYSDTGKLSNERMKAAIDVAVGSSFGYGKAVKSRGGRGIFDGMDQAKNWVDSWTDDTSTTTTARPTTTRTTSTTSSIGSNTNINLGQLISLVKVIADNSDKIDVIAGLLATIATNTESTTNAINSKSSNAKPPSNGLSALRNALNGDGSGQDLLQAVYKIAQS